MSRGAIAIILAGSLGLAAGPAFAAELTPVSTGAAASQTATNRGSYHAQTRAAVADVLSQPEFADLHTDPHAFGKRVGQWIGDIFQTILSPLKHLPEWVLWIVIVWMILTLMAILAHLVHTLWTVVAGAPGRDRTVSSRGRHAGELLGISNLDFDWVYAEARRLYQTGHWLAATKFFYVAAILGLDRQGLISFKASKTNWDYLRELRGRPSVEDLFQRLTGSFEVVVYGGQEATSSTVFSMTTIAAGLLHDQTGAVTR